MDVYIHFHIFLLYAHRKKLSCYKYVYREDARRASLQAYICHGISIVNYKSSTFSDGMNLITAITEGSKS